MDKEYINGRMVESMKEDTMKIKNKGLVFTIGLMVGDFKESGIKASVMVLVRLYSHQDYKSMVFGWTIRDNRCKKRYFQLRV